jgi:hypothetical protein
VLTGELVPVGEDDELDGEEVADEEVEAVALSAL